MTPAQTQHRHEKRDENSVKTVEGPPYLHRLHVDGIGRFPAAKDGFPRRDQEGGLPAAFSGLGDGGKDG